MKRKNFALSFIVGLVIVMISGISVLSLEYSDLNPTNNAFSFASQTTVNFDGVVGRGETDWYYVDAQPGLMQLSVSWGNYYDIDCYISTSASTADYLARGYTTNNPESCSYNIQTAGRYYIGIKMYSWWASDTTYYGTLTYYTGSGGDDTTDPTVSITSPSNGATVQDTISITASASDDQSGIDYLECDIDGYDLGVDSSSPYAWNFDTTSMNDGMHTITVTAYDGAGNTASDTINIEISNGSPDNQLYSGIPVTGTLNAQYDTDMYYINVGPNTIDMRTVLTCGSADFDVYGRLGAEPTTSNYDWRGYTSGGEDVTFNNPGEGTWYIMVRSYSGTGNYELTVSLTTNEPNPDAEKIAVFFWASDAGAQWVIDEYWGVLQNEGYTKIFNFRDTSNFENDFNTVEAYEDSGDTIFFYLFGHGNNNGIDSYTAFAPSSSIVYSSDLRDMFDTLDAQNIGYLIESCHSGGFPEDFHASPYLAMSTSDATHNAYAVGSLPNEGIFSNAFWNHVADGYNAVESFNYAEQVVFNGASSDTYMQYPQIADYSSYVWFD